MNPQPVLGVLTTGGAIQAMARNSPGPRTAILAETAHSFGVGTVFFALGDIDAGQQRITAQQFYGRGGWRQGVFPYPKVFYKRGPTAGRETKYSRFLSQLEEKEAKFLNCPRGFKKWEVYNCLSAQPNVSQYLPDTRLLTGERELQTMLSQYGDVYVKASRGSRGKLVARIVRLESGRCYMYHYDQGLIRSVYKSIPELYAAVSCFVRGRECLVQQAIDLLRYDNRLVDFRAESQRTAQGDIVAYGIPVRVGQRSSPITTHASSYRLEDFLTNCLRWDGGEITAFAARARSFLKDIYSGLEGCYGRCGEIGIDFGLDTGGRLWFIECNSQSAKVSLFASYDAETIRQHYATLVQYAASLAIN